MYVGKKGENEWSSERAEQDCWIFYMVVYIGDFYPPASSFAWIYSVATTQNQTTQSNPIRKIEKIFYRNLSAICVREMCAVRVCICIFSIVWNCLNWNRCNSIRSISKVLLVNTFVGGELHQNSTTYTNSNYGKKLIANKRIDEWKNQTTKKMK